MPPQVSIAKGSVEVVAEVTVGSVDVAGVEVAFVVDSFTPVVAFRGEYPQPPTPIIANISSPIVKSCERRTFPVLVETHSWAALPTIAG
jgi:hypothetical protein